MERTPVSSSNIVSIGYDGDSSTLEIEFKDGSVYQYFGVPGDVYDALMSAPSHGTYFAANIRQSYQYAKL